MSNDSKLYLPERNTDCVDSSTLSLAYSAEKMAFLKLVSLISMAADYKPTNDPLEFSHFNEMDAVAIIEKSDSTLYRVLGEIYREGVQVAKVHGYLETGHCICIKDDFRDSYVRENYARELADLGIKALPIG